MNSSNALLDLRVRRTYKFLWDALMSLMTERDFESITVTEICERAMVHRTTFYKHYEDKYGLLFHGVQDELNALAEVLDSAVDKPLEVNEEPDTMARLVMVFEHVRRHERFYRLMLGGNGYSKFNTLLRKSLADRLKRRIQQEAGQMAMPIDLHAQLQAAAMVGMLEWWLENDFPYTSVEMTQYLDVHFKLLRLSHHNTP